MCRHIFYVQPLFYLLQFQACLRRKNARILLRIRNFKRIYNLFLRFRAPVNFQILLRTSDCCVKYVMSNSFIYISSNNYFNRIIFQTLCLMNEYSICYLKWNICVISKIFILITLCLPSCIEFNDIHNNQAIFHNHTHLCIVVHVSEYHINILYNVLRIFPHKLF